MTKRHNHYEAAFEDLLRARRVPYVAVNEAKRSLVAPRFSCEREPSGAASAPPKGPLPVAAIPGAESVGAHESNGSRTQRDTPTTLKSLDFIVSADWLARSWLVDVKGRRFPSGQRRQFWRNWSTADDLRSLAQWERQFGERFCALLVFAYEVWGPWAPVPAEQLFFTRGRCYAFCGIRLEHYLGFARRLSTRWDTLALPPARFRALAEPIDHLLARCSA